MIRVQVADRYRVLEGYVKEFTRHSSDVLVNLNELRHQDILTDTTLLIGTTKLRAHSAVLIACSGFFYSMLARRVSEVSLSLPQWLDAEGVSLLLDFMYTSRLPLSPHTAPAVHAAASYLQMEHVADACRVFMLNRERTGLELGSPSSAILLSPPGREHPSTLQIGSQPLCVATRNPSENQHDHIVRCSKAPREPGALLSHEPRSMRGELEVESLTSTGSPSKSPDCPSLSRFQPNSPHTSDSSRAKSVPHPTVCNWKKYKFIVLNPLCAAAVKEEREDGMRTPPCNHTAQDPAPESSHEKLPLEGTGSADRSGQCPRCEVSQQSPSGPPMRPCQAEETLQSQGSKGEKPYRCSVCGAQFNRPANLKTHSRIHSGEKPYHCDTCGARFVQVAHLRAHVLIHTGEKPYPCHTCGTRFRHLQTLKSHLRIHTGEKPYACETCDLHFRHKSQLRLHLRQKHGAVTNNKICHDIGRPILQVC